MATLSIVINTLNEEKNLSQAIASVKSIADEIIVVDMQSMDKTRVIAKKLGAKVFLHEPVGYVEPARNFAISKTTSDWVLVLDADEEIGPELAKKIKAIVKNPQGDYYRLPRKNNVFGKWLRHSRWWPDYNIRLFKRGAVTWLETIHQAPETKGEGVDLPAQERLAINHHNYLSVSDYLARMLRYTDIQAKDLVKKGYRFSWQDVAKRPLSEFLSRFFAGEGYKDGIHGLILALLQSFSEVVLLTKVWELQKFPDLELSESMLGAEFSHAEYEVDYWLQQSGMRTYGLPQRLLKKFIQKK